MSHFVAFSPLFTGEMDNPDIGVKVEDYENFEHIHSTVHDKWMFTPETEWKTEPIDKYPRAEYLYLYGFTTHDEDLTPYSLQESWSLNKADPGSQLFHQIWHMIGMTCEPCSALMYEGSVDFPSINAFVAENREPIVKRVDCERGKISIVTIDLHDNSEEIDETYEWDAENYEEETFLGGINY